jgi:hypothetical protein
MRFNTTKCYKVSIHRSNDPYTHHYSLDNHIFEQVENNPYLGVLISRDLKWSTHATKQIQHWDLFVGTQNTATRNLKKQPTYRL